MQPGASSIYSRWPSSHWKNERWWCWRLLEKWGSQHERGGYEGEAFGRGHPQLFAAGLPNTIGLQQAVSHATSRAISSLKQPGAHPKILPSLPLFNVGSAAHVFPCITFSRTSYSWTSSAAVLLCTQYSSKSPSKCSTLGIHFIYTATSGIYITLFWTHTFKPTLRIFDTYKSRYFWKTHFKISWNILHPPAVCRNCQRKPLPVPQNAPTTSLSRSLKTPHNEYP